MNGKHFFDVHFFFFIVGGNKQTKSTEQKRDKLLYFYILLLFLLSCVCVKVFLPNIVNRNLLIFLFRKFPWFDVCCLSSYFFFLELCQLCKVYSCYFLERSCCHLKEFFKSIATSFDKKLPYRLCIKWEKSILH